MKKDIAIAGDQGENWANTQFTDSKLFRVDRVSEERIHMGWDLRAKLLDRDTGKELRDIFYIQAKNYTMKISKGHAILDNAIKAWHLKQWEHLQDLTLVVAYNREEAWNPKESGYWIWHDEIIRQIETRESNWRDREDTSTFRIKIPVSNKLSLSDFASIHQRVTIFFLQLKQNSIKEKDQLSPDVWNATISNEVIDHPEGLFNDLIVSIFKQILSEYQKHEIISKVCKEQEYRHSDRQNLDFSMYPKVLSIPYNDIQKPSSEWIVQTFGSSIAWGEVNALFEIVINSDSIDRYDLDFSRETIISVIDSLNFNPTYMLVSNELFIKWMELFRDRIFFEENFTIMKFDNRVIPVVFVINELAYGKVLIVNQESIETIVKYAEDTTFIKNFENEVPIGPRKEKVDIRVRSNGGNIEFVFRTVRAFNIIENRNILLLDFCEVSTEEET